MISPGSPIESSQPKTLSIGGATYDLFVRLPQGATQSIPTSAVFAIPLGDKVRVEQIIETCGGGASNTAVGLSRLGCTASIASVVGTDQWGDRLMENFRREGVGTGSITMVEGETTSFSIILSGEGGERVILYAPGTNVHMHDAIFDRATASSVDWVILNHIQERACVIQDDLIDILVRTGVRMTWNPGGCLIDRGMHDQTNHLLLSHTELLVMNREELLAFTKMHASEDAMDALMNVGVSRICITDGKQGCVARDTAYEYRCPVCPNVHAIDTTGAGDAFTTGVTWALLSGLDLPAALKAGTINSGSVVGAMGAQAGLLTDTEMRQRLESVNIPVSQKSL